MVPVSTIGITGTMRKKTDSNSSMRVRARRRLALFLNRTTIMKGISSRAATNE